MHPRSSLESPSGPVDAELRTRPAAVECSEFRIDEDSFMLSTVLLMVGSFAFEDLRPGGGCQAACALCVCERKGRSEGGDGRSVLSVRRGREGYPFVTQRALTRLELIRRGNDGCPYRLIHTSRIHLQCSIALGGGCCATRMLAGAVAFGSK